MTVQELIRKLSLEEPNARVVVDSYEAGYDEIKTVLKIGIKPNVGKLNSEKGDKWWEGDFEYSKNKNSEIAILLPRNN